MDSSYLIFDTETGGIGLEKSLLTAYFLVTDHKFNTISDLYLYVKPDDGIYRVEAEALDINLINLREHNKIAIPYKKAGTNLYKFLDDAYKLTNKNRFIPVGHGMSGDFDHIFDKLIGRSTWETFVSYRRLDTSVATQFLKSCGSLPDSISGSLESLAKYFNVVQGQQHDAKSDVLMTRDVLKELIKIINPFKLEN